MASFSDSMESFGPGAMDPTGVSETELKLRELERIHGPLSEHTSIQLGLPLVGSAPMQQFAPAGQPTLASQHESARMDHYLQQMEAGQRQAMAQAKAQMDLMNEARTRFAKAALYEQIIEGQLFEGEDGVTLAVEEEFKAFAEERLMVLLGIQSEKKISAAEEFLDEDEKRVIKLFAAKMLGRQASIPKPAETAQLQAPKPVAASTHSPSGMLAAPKRGRGRPPGTGKNQRAQAVQQFQPQYAPFVPQPFDPRHQQQFQPQPQIDPSATQQIVLPNGQVKTVSAAPSQVKPPPGAPRPVPMPVQSMTSTEMDTAIGRHAEFMTSQTTSAQKSIIQSSLGLTQG